MKRCRKYLIEAPTLGFSAFASHSHKHSIANNSSYKCTYPHTTLYISTFPVQKECVLLMHNGHMVNAMGVPKSNSTVVARLLLIPISIAILVMAVQPGRDMVAHRSAGMSSNTHILEALL